ncbi:unnamed protein product [Acanthoscelides obtectus]|uniref:Uncharacterized protein n=1 Tax=Acanthoscelides obtectus TaxID=200917 RepID=A0A9P0K7P2_ACAOB|nr:unnamed protein product [Acanthoscelides obtectus]CAK1632352.1 hypothetical protein AOBTE_LOCUS7497 [Acanthoscelides obtectus]
MVQFSNQEMKAMHFVYRISLGRPASVRTIQIEEAVLNKIEEDATTGTTKNFVPAKFKSCNGMANFERSATLSISYTTYTSAFASRFAYKS